MNSKDQGAADLVAALQKIASIEDEMFGGDWDEIERAREIARAALSSTPKASAIPGEGGGWMPFALTLATALDRGDDASLLMDENSPLRDELRRLIAQERAITSEKSTEVKEVAPAVMDADGEAFRKAAQLGLTLRFYGGCAQSGMPGSPCAYEVVTNSDRAASMREAVERAAVVIANGGEPQRIGHDAH